MGNYPYGNFGIIMNNSNPDMQSRNIRITGNTIDGGLFGGIFIIGSGNTVTGNHLLHLNMAHCNDPGPSTAAMRRANRIFCAAESILARVRTGRHREGQHGPEQRDLGLRHVAPLHWSGACRLTRGQYRG